MAHDGEKKSNMRAWLGIGLILVGIIAGVYLSDTLGVYINPQKAQLVEKGEQLETQNALLKEQVDCLVDGINLNQGKKTLDECT